MDIEISFFKVTILSNVLLALLSTCHRVSGVPEHHHHKGVY